MPKLAINGGKPVRTTFFPNQNTINGKEIQKVIEVMGRGRLSGYRANWCPEFMGGPEVQKLEEIWQKRFNVKHAIAVNSCTSGLQIACGAIGLQSHDEVIVTPYSMTCSATAPMIYGAKPIFADIEKDYYCLDPESVEAAITSRTKAIITVSLFGQPYDIKINEIAKKHGLMIIEDAAQAIGATIHTREDIWVKDFEDKSETKVSIKSEMRYAGTLGDIGVYSFNYGKHLTCGEGGMIVTNDDELAFRCRLIRNHAEAVIAGMPEHRRIKTDSSLVGFNMRMSEIDAAIIQAQLSKFDDLLEQRMSNVEYLQERLAQIPAIKVTRARENCTHTYYVLPFQWNSEKADGLYRDKYIEAVKAELTPRLGREGEGVPIGCGYIRPLYTMPLFDRERLLKNHSERELTKLGLGFCPVCEDLSYNKLFLTLLHSPNSIISDMKDVADAFAKCWENRGELK